MDKCENCAERPIIDIDPRYARLLVLLIQQRNVPGDFPAEVLGWISKPQLAAAIGELTYYSPETRSISTYLSDISKLIEDAVGTRINVFERQRGAVRLALDLSIVDLTMPGVETPPRQTDGSLIFPTGLDGPAFLSL